MQNISEKVFDTVKEAILKVPNIDVNNITDMIRKYSEFIFDKNTYINFGLDYKQFYVFYIYE